MRKLDLDLINEYRCVKCRPKLKNNDESININNIIHINVKNMNIYDINSDIKQCFECFRLDISENKLKTIKNIGKYLNNLDWLKATDNEINDLKYIEKLHRLKMLNLSNNKINDISRIVNHLNDLKALIMKGNKIKKLPILENPHNTMDTLVLSYNKLRDLNGIENFPHLSKLSVSGNKIKELPSTIQQLSELSELRLNNNRIKNIPSDYQFSLRLKLLDLGENQIDSFETLEAFTSLPYLRNISLRGNPLTNQINYRAKLHQMFPKVKIFDGQKAEKFIEAKVEKLLNIQDNDAIGDDSDDLDLEEFKRQHVKQQNDNEMKEESNVNNNNNDDDDDEPLAKRQKLTGVVSVKIHNTKKKKKKRGKKVNVNDLSTNIHANIGQGGTSSAWD